MKVTLTQDDLDTALDSYKAGHHCHCLVEQAIMRELNSEWASAGFTNCTVKVEDGHHIVYRLSPIVAPYIKNFDNIIDNLATSFTQPLPFEFDVELHDRGF